jgi:hypothetical protein
MALKKIPEDDKDGAQRNPVANGGGPPYDGEMEARIAKLEEFVVEARTELRAIDVRLGKIEMRLDVTATKADIQDTANALIKWIVATAALLGAAAISVMTFVLNNAATHAGPSAPVPIVITVPVPPAAPVAPPTSLPAQ